MSHEFQIAPEMYLKTIFTLETRTGAARTGDIAKVLRITPGSVTNTLEVLETKGLVAREPYKGVKLTEQGRKLALSVFRKHRLAERMLTDLLHLGWVEAHDEACKLEHVLSDRLVSSIEKALDSPKTCPHGNPIPDEQGTIMPLKSRALSTLEVGRGAVLTQIPEENGELLRYLEELGMLPGAKMKVEERAPFNGPITVRMRENSYALSPEVASEIYVTPEQ